jgi:lipopolysaccharide export system protein LptA
MTLRSWRPATRHFQIALRALLGQRPTVRGKRSGWIAVGLLTGWVVGVALWCARSARAEPIAVVDGQPIMVTAEHLAVDVHAGTALLSGKVQLQRGQLTIRCDRVEARYDDAPNVTWARATGDVTAELGELHARAHEAELLVRSRTLVLRSGVKIRRGGAWMEAREAQIDFGTGRITLEQVTGSIPVGSATGRGATDARP